MKLEIHPCMDLQNSTRTIENPPQNSPHIYVEPAEEEGGGDRLRIGSQENSS